jgi:hypothetical protein
MTTETSESQLWNPKLKLDSKAVTCSLCPTSHFEW